MGIAVLICLTSILSAGSWVFIVWKDIKECESGNRVKEALQKNKKETIFLLIATALMIALSVELNLIYKTNTLVANIELISLLSLLMTAAVTDYKSHIIPNKIIIVGLALRVVFAIIELITLKKLYFSILKADGIALAIVVVLLLLGVFIVKNGIAMGDIKLMAVMAVFQGFTGFMSSLFCSLLITFIVGIVLLITKKKKRKDAIAFAPALFVGTLISVALTGM